MSSDWENKILETGLFEWHREDGGKIFRLKGTNFVLARKNIWIRPNNDPDDPAYIVLHTKFEEFLEDLSDEEIQAKLLFHLDLFT